MQIPTSSLANGETEGCVTKKRKGTSMSNCQSDAQKHSFSNEILFTVEQQFNHQNDRIYVSDISTAIFSGKNVFRMQKSAFVMIWADITADSKTSLFFIDEGVKVNQEVYQDRILKSVLLPWSKSILRTHSGPFNGAQRCSIKQKQPKPGAEKNS